MITENTVAERAAVLERELLQRQVDYLESCREYGEQGYRHPECFHGTYQWVDYDPICGSCEEPETSIDQYSSEERVREFARELAEAEFEAERIRAEREAAKLVEREEKIVEFTRYLMEKRPDEYPTEELAEAAVRRTFAQMDEKNGR